MNKKQLDELLYCLSDERNTYTYFKDKYCMFLFQQMIDGTISVQELKNSQYAQFCNKPILKQWLAQYGSNQIDEHALTALWQPNIYHFSLTLGQWGGRNNWVSQTCRNGHNLVLQLNFTKDHDRLLNSVVKKGSYPFSYFGHPISSNRNTLAWSRLDFSEDLTEVLIEEIQNDWLRRVENTLRFLQKPKNEDCFERYGIRPDILKLENYFDKVIKPLKSLWDEAILCATLEYLANHIGVKHVYYYDHETGAKLKYCSPPRSLYTTLPRKFGFKLVDEAPKFISEDKYSRRKLKKIKSAKWHYLQL